MLRRSYIQVPGVGERRERQLWTQGYVDWETFRERHPRNAWREQIVGWLEPERAARGLPRREMWRLAREFPGRTAFLDIETEGLAESDGITCVGISDGRRVEAYVRGDNLSRLPEALERFELLVTYNGACFDLPVLQRTFREIDFRRFHHIDLRYPLHRLGVKGGLKGAERQLGIARSEAVAGVDGFVAVLLWRAHENGHPNALETLVRYCLEDVVHLQPLLAVVHDRLSEGMPVPVDPMGREPEPEIPYRADVSLVRDLVRPAEGRG